MRIRQGWSSQGVAMLAASTSSLADSTINHVAGSTTTANTAPAAPSQGIAGGTGTQNEPGSPGPSLAPDQAVLLGKENRVQEAMAVLEAGKVMGSSGVANAALNAKLTRVLKNLNRGDYKAAR